MNQTVETQLANERAPTVSESGRRLWLYPDRRKGKRADVREKLSWLLLVFYLAAPWLRINEAPLIRLDVLDRKAYIFGSTFYTFEANYLVFLFLIAAFTLFLVTALFGRLWCGYGCPQTVFVEWVIRPIEEFVEGNARHRHLADDKPWSKLLVAKKMFKHLLFFVVAAVVANTFLAYFIDPKQLLHWISAPPTEHPIAFASMTFVFAAFYFDLVWFREQFCSFLCPYARLQTVLMDEHSPAITYDAARGDPKGRGPDKGDCIDCQLCVRVCPTGIDIRQGLQLECIMCGRCADACDTIMHGIKRPAGLIRKTSQAELTGSHKKVMRPRVIIYSAILASLCGIFALALHNRTSVEVGITRASGQTFAVLPDGRVSNLFTLRVVNRQRTPTIITLSDIEPAGAVVVCTACDEPIAALSEKVITVIVMVQTSGSIDPMFRASVNGGKKIEAPLIIPKTQ